MCFLASNSPSGTGRFVSFTRKFLCPCFAQDATSLGTPVPLLWGFRIHPELWCPLPSELSHRTSGRPLQVVEADCRRDVEQSMRLFYRPQVRELEKQLGQTQSRSVGTAGDELSVCPDPRKLSAQERNLLRIRNLEREKQEGWEVRHAWGDTRAPGAMTAPVRTRGTP